MKAEITAASTVPGFLEHVHILYWFVSSTLQENLVEMHASVSSAKIV